MNGVLSEEVVTQEPRGAQTLPTIRPPRPDAGKLPRRFPTAKSSKSKISLQTRRVLEKFLERSLSLDDATPMQRVYESAGELDVIEEDGTVPPPPKRSPRRTPEKRTPVVTPVKTQYAPPTGVKPSTGAPALPAKPYSMKKALTDPARVHKPCPPTPDEDVWVLRSQVGSPSSQSSKSVETLKANCTLVSDDSSKSKSTSHLASPVHRPPSAVIAQTEFSIVNILDSEYSPKKSRKKTKQKSLDNLLNQTSAGQATVMKAETISTSSREQYFKELASKPKESAKEGKKKNGKSRPASRIDNEPVKVASVQKSMTISASSYHDWKVEKKGANGGRRNSYEGSLDILEKTSTLHSTASVSTSTISSDDYHEPKVGDEGNRKKKTGFKRAMERLRMSYRRKIERPSSVNSAEFYAIKPKPQKPMFKKKKKRADSFRFLKFWKKASSSDEHHEHEKLKNMGLNDPGLLDDSHSDDAKKGVMIKTKHHHKKEKKPDENAWDTLVRQIRKSGSTLRRRISRKESLRSPGCKSKSLDVLDESPGSSDLGSTSTSLPAKHYLTVDNRQHGRPRKSSNGSLHGSRESLKYASLGRSPKEITEGFGAMLDTSLNDLEAPESPGGDGMRRRSSGGLRRRSSGGKENEEEDLDAFAKKVQSTVKSKEMRRRLKLEGLEQHGGPLPDTDLVADGLGDGDNEARKPMTPSAIEDKLLEERTDEEKEIIYDKVAKKLAEIADTYVHKVESTHESSSEPTSPMVLTTETGSRYNTLELKLAELLRDKGDAINENGDLPTEAVKKIVTDTTYSQFQKHMSNMLPKSDGLQQIAVLFHLTKSAVQWAGTGAQQAGRIKEMSLRFFEDKFAEWLSDQGGWDSMMEDSSDFELD